MRLGRGRAPASPARPSFIGSPSLMPVLVLVLALLGMLGMLVLCRGALSL